MTLDLKLKVSGEYEIFKRKEGSDSVKVAQFPNLITDAGLDFFGTIQATYNVCSLGSGTTPPVNSDTALVSKVASASKNSYTSVVQSTTKPYYTKLTVKYTFNPGTIAGSVSEIGISPATTGSLFSRALIRDDQGNPTTLTVLSDEYLDVYYNVYWYHPTGDVPFSLDISGTVYTGFVRPKGVGPGGKWSSVPCNISQFVSSLTSSLYTGVAILEESATTPTGPLSSKSASQGVIPYIPGSKYLDFSYTWIPSDGRKDIKTMTFSNAYSNFEWQLQFDTVLVKTETQQLTYNVRISWDRA